MLQLRDGQAPATAIHRADYQAPAWWIDTVDLTFDLDPAKTRVLNKMRVRRNTEVPAQPLRLDGDELNLARVLVNGGGTSFKMDGDQLVLENLPGAATPSIWKSSPPARPPRTHQAHGPVCEPGHVLHPVRGRGFPPHHLFPGPSRRDGHVHRDAARRQDRVPGAAVQRQPGRARRAGRRPPLRQVGRSAPQAQLPVRPGGRQPGCARAKDQEPRGPRPPAAGLRAPRRPGRPSTP